MHVHSFKWSIELAVILVYIAEGKRSLSIDGTVEVPFANNLYPYSYYTKITIFNFGVPDIVDVGVSFGKNLVSTHVHAITFSLLLCLI